MFWFHSKELPMKTATAKMHSKRDTGAGIMYLYLYLYLNLYQDAFWPGRWCRDNVSLWEMERHQFSPDWLLQRQNIFFVLLVTPFNSSFSCPTTSSSLPTLVTDWFTIWTTFNNHLLSYLFWFLDELRESPQLICWMWIVEQVFHCQFWCDVCSYEWGILRVVPQNKN